MTVEPRYAHRERTGQDHRPRFTRQSQFQQPHMGTSLKRNSALPTVDPVIILGRGGGGLMSEVQGYLAHEKQPPPLGTSYVTRHTTVQCRVLARGALFVMSEVPL